MKEPNIYKEFIFMAIAIILAVLLVLQIAKLWQ